MELHEYAALDAVGLRALIRAGEVTAGEVEQVARTALAIAGPELNALTLGPFGTALDHDPDGPLGGVPFVVKDSGPFARRVPFTLGSRAIRGAVALVDHDLMTRFRSAGLVTLGQSTAPELGLSFATEPVATGPTRNPWDPEHGAGGSSGGAAALVAAGAVPLAHANDGAGSIRVPASCCGLVGLKPSRGRTPCGPYAGEVGFGLVVEFALTRTVRDAAALLDAVCAPPVGDKFALPAPTRPYAEELCTDPGRLQVALTTTAWSGVPVDAEVAAVTTTVGQTLEWLGHTVSEATPGLDPDAIVEGAVLAAVATGAALLLAPVRPDRSRLAAVSRQVLAETESFTVLDVQRAADAQHRVTRPVGLFLNRYDLLVTPTLGRLPARHGTLDYDNPHHTVRSWLRRLFEYGPFTAPFNISGHPAISLPLGQSRTGLPIGVQLVAGRGREDLLLRVAAQLEQAVPWAGRRPAVVVDGG
ncbi:amidase family protein [Solwaraspora sp. WMMD1047]|uniref:amidase n=1 Tax=Solwaraspora sp. WMMD1047 TaxID=3016102 RepID=UPI002416463D|nr:amidase family protein [Solwaraspora sp. WMMD1047]MDG4831336.1 amidase family protein [Solwaraspora sp. WMMD1047]